MNTIPATNINKISITGQVVGPSYDQDHNKLIFNLENSDGKFYVEFHSSKAEVGMTQGARVMVTGSIFSLRSDRYRLIRIRARSVHILDDECNELM
jgi:RNase P/RNase MRP subunit p29